MPRLSELQNRMATHQTSTLTCHGETLVADARAEQTPAEFVDQKLFALLDRCSSLPQVLRGRPLMRRRPK